MKIDGESCKPSLWQFSPPVIHVFAGIVMQYLLSQSQSLIKNMKQKFFRYQIIVTLLAGAIYPAYPQDTEKTARPLITGLDHIIIVVSDLEAAFEQYRKLGFVLKPGRRHENGIRNRHVKFPDGTEIELITAQEARDPLTGEYRRYLQSGDGPVFAGFYSPYIDAAARILDSAGKTYSRSGGMLTFSEKNSLRYIFFGSRNKSPTDRPEHFKHPNGAGALTGVWIAGDNFEAEKRLMSVMGTVFEDRDVNVPDKMRAATAKMEEGKIVFLPESRQLLPGRRIIGASIRTRDLKAVRQVLEKNFPDKPELFRIKGRSLFIPPNLTYGIWLEFREGK